jgi:hypothetical protein
MTYRESVSARLDVRHFEDRTGDSWAYGLDYNGSADMDAFKNFQSGKLMESAGNCLSLRAPQPVDWALDVLGVALLSSGFSQRSF